MKLACTTLLYDALPLPQALKRIAEIGFAHADLCVSAMPGWGHLKPADVQAEPLPALELLEEAERGSGVKIVALNLNLDTTSLSERGQFEAVCRLARRGAIPVVSVAAGVRHEDVEMRRLKDFQAIASDLGVTLCVETHRSPLFLDSAMAAQLARGAGFRLTLDPSHLLQAGRGPETWGPVFGVTGHVHLWDTGLSPDHLQVPFGKGALKLDPVLEGLHAAKYQGAVTLEYLGPRPQDLEPFDAETAIRDLARELRARLGNRIA